MPCSDGGPTHNDFERQRERADDLAQMLCELCKKTPESKMSPRLKKWWAQHKKEDERRERLEKEAATRERKRNKALAKLTVEEMKILGVK